MGVGIGGRAKKKEEGPNLIEPIKYLMENDNNRICEVFLPS